MPDDALRKLKRMSEINFTKKRVMPIFEGLDYKCVTYVGGGNPPERGRDVVFYEIDEKLSLRRDMAAQVKKGDIKAADARGLLDQITEAFSHPHRDPETGDQRRITRLFIVASGKIRTSVVERIQVEHPHYFPMITLWSGEHVLERERALISGESRVSQAEKHISALGLEKLFDEEEFIEVVSRSMQVMFEKLHLSSLRILGKLPEILIKIENVKSKVDVLSVAEQKEVLNCLAVLIIAKSNYNLGAHGKYGIWNIERA